MVFKCCVNGCKYVGKSGFHSFPANEEAANKWILLSKVKQPNQLKIRLANKKLSHSFYKICNKHFEPKAYTTNENGERRLLKGAFPTLFLPADLIRIKKEHDYAMGARMQILRRPPLNTLNTNSKNFAGNETKIDNNSNSNIVVFDYPHSANVGANMEAVLNGNLNTSQENTNGICNDTVGVCIDSNYEGHKDCAPLFRVNPVVFNAVDIILKDIADELNYYKKRCEELEKRCEESEDRYQKLEHESKEIEWNDDNVVEYLRNKFNKQQLEFFKMQIYNCGKPLNGRRYNQDQKSLTLAMYKQSPKKYRFLKRMFILPSKSTLGRHSAKLMFQAGIDKKLLNVIKEKVKTLPEIDKYCVISWDEVALTAHIDYSKKRDVIDGFVELNDSRRPELATHSLTFMVRGINAPYKEPVAYFYTAGLTSIELVELVKLTIGAVFDTGLIVIGSMCDQPGTNVAAVHKLINPKCNQKTPDGKLLEYKVRNHIIYHMYDPPHLLKVARNNLLTKDLQHFLDKAWEASDPKHISLQKPKYASWDHVSDLYQLDCRATKRLLPKLTNEHITPMKEKMTVSVATQVFSKTVGNVMLRLSQKTQLPHHFADTAYALLFFNDLFDSLNGSGSVQSNSLKSAVNEGSIHFVFWEYALSVLANMNFVDKSDKQINNKSTVLKKMESTVRGYMQISKMCLKIGISEISLRNINQDGLENFFGQCKGLCGSKPIASHYRSAYTTMIINNLIGATSAGSNCEEDKFFALLSNIDEMLLDCEEPREEHTQLTNSHIKDIENEIDMLETIVFDPFFGEKQLNFIENESLSNSSIVVCRKLLQLTNCDDCKSSLQEHSVQSEENELNIVLPSQSFTTHFESVFCGLNFVIPHLCSEKFVKKKSIQHIESIQVCSIGCVDHCDEMAIKFKELIANYAIILFCNDINNILSGKTSILPPNPNIIQQKALVFQQKRKRIGKFSDVLIK